MNEEEIKSLVAQREQARSAKDFATADALRDQLRKSGVEIYDKDKYVRMTTATATATATQPPPQPPSPPTLSPTRTPAPFARSKNATSSIRSPTALTIPPQVLEGQHRCAGHDRHAASWYGHGGR